MGAVANGSSHIVNGPRYPKGRFGGTLTGQERFGWVLQRQEEGAIESGLERLGATGARVRIRLHVLAVWTLAVGSCRGELGEEGGDREKAHAYRVEKARRGIGLCTCISA